MARRERYIFAEEPKHGHGFLIGFIVVLTILIASLFVWNFALNHTVSYTKQYVTVTNLPSALENYTIFHLSDLNGTSIGENQSAIKKAIGTKSVSCVVLSGNMVGEAGNVQPVLDLIAILPPDTPILLLPGESDPPLYATTAHSSLSPYADWAQRLIDAGVTILDEPVSFKRDRSTIWFIPEHLYTLNLDNRQKGYQDQLDTLNAILEPLTPDQAAMKRNAESQLERVQRIRESIVSMTEKDIQIVVSSTPLDRDYIATAKASVPAKQTLSFHHVSLVMSGGTCAGQWRIPGVGAIWSPDSGFFPEDTQLSGMSYLGGIWQHISPGLGVSDRYPLLPFRLFNSPNVTLLVLSASMH